MPTYNYLSDRELMQKLIKTIDKNSQPDMNQIMQNNNVLSLINNETNDKKFPDSNKIQTSLELIREMYYRANRQSLPLIKQINTKDKIETYLKTFFHGLNQEKFVCIAINDICNVLDVKEMWIGRDNECTVSIKELVRWAIENRAVGILVAHNHPNGTEPSKPDIQFANQFYKALQLMEIEMLDSVVVTDKDYFSMAHLKLIDFFND